MNQPDLTGIPAPALSTAEARAEFVQTVRSNARMATVGGFTEMTLRMPIEHWLAVAEIVEQAAPSAHTLLIFRALVWALDNGITVVDHGAGFVISADYAEVEPPAEIDPLVREIRRDLLDKRKMQELMHAPR